MRELPELSQPNALPDPTGLTLLGADFTSVDEVWLSFRSPSPRGLVGALSVPFVEVLGVVAELDTVLETLDIVFPLGRKIFMFREEVPVPVPARA